ncbi:Hypothetical Protein FCC1311_011212 [Hondaea fermentalgiana]|uniref:Uncharacterized protein n=1 Tax=Hondaea fermentalgiana TaxID=2315210 RepID=A0A2R5G8U2_9STRA|nr:Hypothetical Protein FCC1311_011212 [Hondaea fermentalgiana]|eukprot:GBG24903.1 Hypothetical Protein FCC1311_011212 [Hondaea fermentalgiana]
MRVIRERRRSRDVTLQLGVNAAQPRAAQRAAEDLRPSFEDSLRGFASRIRFVARRISILAVPCSGAADPGGRVKA